MAVEVVNDANASTVRDARYFTGVIPYNVIAINPNLQELHDLGLTYIKKDPEYQKEMDFGSGPIRRTQIDIWLRNIPTPECDSEIITKLIFQVDKTAFVGQNTGKTQYINKYGRTAWANNVAELASNPYYLNDESRPAHKGEEDLYKFIFAWLNMSYDPDRKLLTECRIDIEKLFNGDFSELQELVEVGEPYVVKVLTGVRRVEDEANGSVKYYQTTYNKYFLKHNQKITTNLQKHVEKDEYTAFKDAFSFSYKVKEFDPSGVPDTESTPAPSTASSNPF